MTQEPSSPPQPSEAKAKWVVRGPSEGYQRWVVFENGERNFKNISTFPSEQRAREYAELMTESYGNPIESHQNAWKAVSDTIQERDQLREQLEQANREVKRIGTNQSRAESELIDATKELRQLREQLAAAKAEGKSVRIEYGNAFKSLAKLLGLGSDSTFAMIHETLRSKLAERATPTTGEQS